LIKMPLIFMDLHVRISGMALEPVSVGLARSHAQIFYFRPSPNSVHQYEHKQKNKQDHS